MKVLLAGATGVIGRRLVPLLIDGGHDVISITRSKARLGALQAQGVTATECDVFDAGRLKALFNSVRPDIVINQLTSIPVDLHPRRIQHDMSETNRLRVDGTRLLLEAAIEANTRRFISQSVAFAYRPRGTDPAVEDDPLYTDAPISFATMVGAVRRCEYQTLHTPEIDGTILRYGFFYGPGTIYAREGSFATGVIKRRIPIVGHGSGVFSFIHVQDAAVATMCAMNEGAAGVFNICDDEPAPVHHWLPFYADLLDAPIPLTVPAVVGRVVGGSYLSYLMTEQRGAANDRAKKVLRWQPEHTSWRDGFQADPADRAQTLCESPNGIQKS